MIRSASLLALSLGAAFGQSTTDRPAFEVVSIKPSPPGTRGKSIRSSPGGRFTAKNADLKMLMTSAYGVQDFRISGGPGWLSSEGYDITAKAESNVSGKQVLKMVQTLLEDRFKLVLHRETQELPIYALVIAKRGLKDGPSLHEVYGDCDANAPLPSPVPGQPPAPRCGGISIPPGQLIGRHAAITFMADALSRQLGRPVVDKTDLKGTFDVNLKWTPDESQLQLLPGGGQIPRRSDPDGPSIFTAVQEQLGLKLEAQKGPVEILVIDHAEKPSDN